MARRLPPSLALAIACVVGACTNHDPVLGRVGPGPIPTDDGSTAAGAFPCDVQKVLEARCWRCHANPPQNGAPFPLLVYGDTQKEYLQKPIWRRMYVAVRDDIMPFTQLPLDPPVQPLDATQKATLLAWLRSGTPPDGGAAGAAGASSEAGLDGAAGASGEAGVAGAAGSAGGGAVDAGDVEPSFPPPPAGPGEACP